MSTKTNFLRAGQNDNLLRDYCVCRDSIAHWRGDPHGEWGMKERPIVFSAPMVNAILEGRKTQTRRIVEPQPVRVEKYEPDSPFVGQDGLWRWHNGKIVYNTNCARCPYGKPGDRLWVRERHCFLDVTKSALSQFPMGPQNGDVVGPDVWNLEVEYSDGTQRDMTIEGSKPKQTRDRGESGWRSPIHMPRWASRITLEITGVRVERLQDISEADARAEGAKSMDIATGRQTLDPNSRQGSYVAHYREIWKGINGPESWDANPWVWVIEFKRVPQ